MSIQTVLRTVIASGFVVGAVASAFAPAAFAANNDGHAQQGELAAIEDVVYTPASKFNFNADAAVNNESFGSVNVHSNANNGWTLYVASTNGSILKNGSIGSIAYTLKVNDVGVDVSTAATNVSAKDVSVLTGAATNGVDYSVKGSITAAASNGKAAGTYSDTLTFTLTNK